MSKQKNIETAKYQRILDAALQVFADKGFYEAKISDIARIAGVADGTIYLYFKNKDDLLISLFEAQLEAINRGLRVELAQYLKAQERLQHIVEYHLRLAINNPSLAIFITIELRRSAKFVRDYAKAQFAEYLDQWAQVIRDGKAAGEFREDMSPGLFKHILFGALDEICVTWVNNPQRKPEELYAIGQQLTQFMLRGVACVP
jgi:TetR/AcrR family fatty acid metabolism transcriptional regulator